MKVGRLTDKNDKRLLPADNIHIGDRQSMFHDDDDTDDLSY